MHYERPSEPAASIDQALEELDTVIDRLLSGTSSGACVKAIPWDTISEEDDRDSDPGRGSVHVRLEWKPWRDQTFCLERWSARGGRVELFASPAVAARAFWRAALRNGRGVRYDARDGAAVVEDMVVLFRDGRWDALSSYRPDSDEELFWSEVAGCYAELPGWLLR